ncbi:MAG: hypothetical protein WCE54_12340 [Ignavibacteriaceae bacterium]
MIQNQFGFLDYKNSIVFENGIIEPIPKFDENFEWIKNYLNKDGFIYPPIAMNYRIDFSSNKREEIPNTEKPALLHKIPPSHNIMIDNPIYSVEYRKWDLNFIIQMLAFIKGVRLQFAEWWFDGRVAIKNTNNLSINASTLNEFISHSYKKWKDLDEPYKKWFINILFMHNRTSVYEWDWEKFMMNYTVFDGSFKLFAAINKIKNRIKHEERFKVLFDFYEIPYHEEYINQIIFLRNDLFHQTIWDGGLPTASEDKYKGFYHEISLKNINLRIITAIIGYKTNFIKTPWWSVHRVAFDPKFYQKS